MEKFGPKGQEAAGGEEESDGQAGAREPGFGLRESLHARAPEGAT
jgi:hypothetical protein